MNIGIVTTWFERGAAYVSRQYKVALEPVHPVFIYARSGETYAKNDPIWDGPTVTWGKPTPDQGGTVIDLQDFKRWIEVNKIELVIFNEQISWPPVLFCHELGVITGAYIDYYTEETVPFFACYDFLICNTKRHYSAFDWHPQCWYIPWGTDINVFTPTPSPNATGEKTEIRFFHSAGMSPIRKGTDLLIQAYDLLAGKAHLTIHGQSNLAVRLPKLAKTIEALTQAGQLTIIEKTVPAPGLYHLGDVYVYPTRLEGIGLTIAEAMACGLPVITTDQPPMSEFIHPPHNGQLVAVERLIARADGYYWPQSIASIAGLQQAMQFYVDHADTLTDLKTKARQYAVDHLDWRENAKPLLTHIAHVQKRPSADIDAVGKEILARESWRRRLIYQVPTLYGYADQIISALRGSLTKLRRR